tara:strand:- start:1379 stop:1645 length:267 start_codon:yes stop_codon:yes gene_type:complete
LQFALRRDFNFLEELQLLVRGISQGCVYGLIALGFVLIYKATEAITDYQDIFGYQIQFGPGDHKGVSESLLSVVEGGKWKTLATAISY